MFCSAAQRKAFGICQQKQLKLTVFCSATQRNLSTKTTQIDCILFCRAAKSFGIGSQKQLKLTVFCSAARGLLEFTTQIDCICFPRNESFGICQQKQLKLTVLAAQREFLEFNLKSQIDSILFAAQEANKSNSN
jgi:hypothetical protein